MELAEPSIATAYRRCVEQGAEHIIVHPYFLSRGRHIQEDIPALLQDAASMHPSTSYQLTEPLGLQPQVVELIANSIQQTVNKGASQRQ